MFVSASFVTGAKKAAKDVPAPGGYQYSSTRNEKDNAATNISGVFNHEPLLRPGTLFTTLFALFKIKKCKKDNNSPNYKGNI